MMNANARAIEKKLEERIDRSAWNKAINTYALELLEDITDDEEVTRERLLNGANDWKQYSWGGSSLIYDCDIAERTFRIKEDTQRREKTERK